MKFIGVIPKYEKENVTQLHPNIYVSVWPQENLQKHSPLWNTLFQFDSKINNTYPGFLETTSTLALWQKLRAQVNYFHFRPLNRLFNQLYIMQFDLY